MCIHSGTVPPTEEQAKDLEARWKVVDDIISNFAVGTTDQSGRHIDAIYAKNEASVVYSSGERIRVYIALEKFRGLEHVAGPHQKLRAMWIDVVKIRWRYTFLTESLRLVKNSRTRTGLLEAIGVAVASAVNETPWDTLDNIAEIERRLFRIVALRSRLQYAAGCIVFSGVLLAGVVISCILHRFGPPLFNSPNIECGILAIGAGQIGGLLSVLARIRNISIDIENSVVMNMLYGGSRMLVAALASSSAYILYVVGVLPLGKVDVSEIYMVLLVGLLSGFSEALIPGLLTNFASTPSSGRMVGDTSDLDATQESGQSVARQKSPEQQRGA